MASVPETYQKLVVVQSHDDLRQAVEVQTVPMDQPAADEVLVRTMYTGVNAADYLMAAGRYLAATPPPYDLGAESVGEVVAAGADVTGIAVGDAVFAMGGGYREYFVQKASRVIPMPSAMREAVVLGVSGLTASIALNETGEMTSGETVLVTAAAGGTGSMAVQLAKIAGNTVIGTAGSDEKVEYLRSIGCDRPINYRQEDVKAVLKEEFPRGVDIVFECVGGEMFDVAVKSLAVRGRLIAIGAISEYESGPQAVTSPRINHRLLGKSASVRGFWLMHFLDRAKEHAARLISLVQSGELVLTVDEARFSGVEGAFDALAHMYNGQNVGKVVVEFP